MSKDTATTPEVDTEVTPTPEVDTGTTVSAAGEAKVKKMVRGMKAKLDARPKVKIKIPIDKQNPKDLTCFAQINGYTYTIKRGVEVEVPDVVKKLLERGGYI